MADFLRFTIKAVNAKGMDEAFGGLVAKIRDWRSLWPAIINQICKAEERAFSTQGALTHTGEWAPLSPAYAKAKLRKYGDQLIETASERLRRSLTGHTADTIEVSEPLRMQFGTSVPYAIYQQTGTRKMPARRLIDLTPEDAAIIRKQIQFEALNFTRRLGFKAIAAAGGDVSQFDITAVRQAGIQALNEGSPIMTEGTPLF